MLTNENIQDMYELSPMQACVYYSYLNDEKSEAYFQQVSYRFSGELDFESLNRSFQLLIDRHDVLRTVFNHKRVEIPLQIVLKKVQAKVEYIDLKTFIDKEKEVVSNREKDRKRGFDLNNENAVRLLVLILDANSYEFIWSYNHILMDGWCSGIIISEFNNLYVSISNNTSLKYEKPTPFVEYIKWLKHQNKADGKLYWKRLLEGYEGNMSSLCQVSTNDYNIGYNRAKYSVVMSPQHQKIILELSEENEITINTIIQTLWGILRAKLGNSKDVVFGSVTSGRPATIPGIERIVGLFINTIPVRINFKDNPTISKFLKNCQLKNTESENYSFLPLYDIQNESSQKQSLIDHIFIFENYPVQEQIENNQENIENKRKGLKVEKVVVFEQTNYNLNISVSARDKINVSFEYNANIYNKSLFKNLSDYLFNIIENIAKNKNQTVDEIEILSELDKQELLYEFNDTKADYPKDKTIHQLFEEQVKRTPDNIAVLKGEECLTYRELNSSANQLARYCRIKGVVEESKVGLITDHSLIMLIGMLGIMKSGGCYVPIDSSYPEERIHYIIEDAEIDILLLSHDNLSNFRNIGIGIDLDDKRIYQGFRRNLENINKSSDLSYIIYTSGSTGKPKGVMVEHRNVVSYINAFQEEFCLNSRDIMMQQASISFDTFVEEVYPILTLGGKLAVMGKDEILDIEKFGELILNYNITVISCSPLLLNEINAFPFHVFRNVRLFISGGDELRYSYITNLLIFSRVYNTYGPTETTVCSLYYECEKDYVDKIPIGSPIMNSSVYVLGNFLELLPVGVSGELCISGAGLSRGYVNNDNLTTEKFVLHPFKEGERLYRTGDLARWLPDGNIEFLGRIDHQVKIRGFRIELREIENVLQKHENIQENVVISREENGDKYLCAYIVCKGDFSQEEIRTYLSSSLPDYMVPSYFVELDKLPLTSNGKVNRKALPLPEVKAGNDYVAPSTETEQKLVSIWSEVLNIEKEEISIRANFFVLGGHSLKSMILQAKISKACKIEISIRDIFELQTIENISNRIDDLLWVESSEENWNEEEEIVI